MFRLRSAIILAAFLFAVGCGGSAPEQPESEAGDSASRVIITVAPLPSLYPTTTRPAAVTSENAVESLQEPATRAPTSTPVDLNEPVLTLSLQIPEINFDRSITGNVAGAVTLTDENSADSVVLARSGRLLAEIRAALLETTIDPLPAEGCDRCVQIEFALPADGLEQSGWLRDPILIASLEFLFANSLGPHFPPDTAIGFYRSASGYTVAHTVAILNDGAVYRWVGPDDQLLDQIEYESGEIEEVIASIEQLPLRLWEDDYTALCPSYPLEILYLRPPSEVKEIDIQCPELTLPTTLIPIYERVNQFTADILAEERNIPFPEQPLPLEAVVFYLRPDSAALTIFADGSVIASDPAGNLQNTVIPLEFIEPLIDDLTNSDVLPRGVEVLINPQNSQNFEELLLVRGELGVYELPWRDRVGQSLLPGVLSLENLLIDLVGPLQEDLLTPTISATLDASSNLMGTATITTTIPLSGTIAPEAEGTSTP